MLTLEIIKHIYKNLGLIDNLKHYYSIIDNKFLLNKKISFLDENDNTIENNVWGIELTSNDEILKILVANCSITNIPEYSVIISLNNIPPFALSLIDDKYGTISYFVNRWINSSIYLQANLLAGMEKLKDESMQWKKCNDFDDLYKKMIMFIEYSDEVLNEG